MKKSLNYILCLLLFAVSACKKKEYPKPTSSSETTFSTKLMVNGQPLELTTGKNGYYMYSSYVLDSSNVYNLVGEFKQTGCSTCPNSLKIQINDSKVSSANNPIDINSALQVKNYPFLSGSTDLQYSMSFSGTFNKSISTAFWDFGDGTTSSELNPIHTFNGGSYQVSLTMTGLDGCQSTNINTISVKSPSDLNGFITGTTVQKTISLVAHVKGGKAPFTYAWEFGDGATGSGSSISHTYPLKGSYGVKLQITDSDGKNTSCNYNAVSGPDPSACAANFVFTNPIVLTSRSAFSKTIVQFTDANGTIFTSDNALQPASSSLEIISVEEFTKNENDQSVKKVKLKFNGFLYNNNRSISLQGNEVTIGFAYK